jgi:hypothetical protein
MPSRTLEDKVEDLTKLVATHAQLLQTLQEALKGTVSEHSETGKVLSDLRTCAVRLEQQIAELSRWKAEVGSLSDLRTETAILRRDVDRLEQAKEEVGRRFWAMAGPIIGAVVGVVLGYFLKK